jgi:hypothetical protein
MPTFNEPLRDRLWSIRFKRGPNPVETKHIEARNAEYAERIARKWCEQQGDGLRPVRFINVEPFIIADESILQDQTPAVVPAPAVGTQVRQ